MKSLKQYIFESSIDLDKAKQVMLDFLKENSNYRLNEKDFEQIASDFVKGKKVVISNEGKYVDAKYNKKTNLYTLTPQNPDHLHVYYGVKNGELLEDWSTDGNGMAADYTKNFIKLMKRLQECGLHRQLYGVYNGNQLDSYRMFELLDDAKSRIRCRKQDAQGSRYWGDRNRSYKARKCDDTGKIIVKEE